LTAAYDSNGQLIQIVLPNGEKLEIGYDEDGEVKDSIIKEKNKTTANMADMAYTTDMANAKNEIEIDTVADNKVQVFIYDEETGLLFQCSLDDQPTVINYDKFNRINKKTYKEGLFELFEYDYAGNVSAFTNTCGETAYFTYNSLNKIKEQIDFFGGRLQFYYTPGGDLSCTRKL